ncbi:MAG: molybdopterin molybdotransferase MoeA [Parasporobacterium sp.]|nr:molybdopterin molybdotransferase MoeA [Parasporobacterium sp.]
MQTKMAPVNQLPSPPEAIKLIGEAFSFVPETEMIAIGEANGRTLAEDIKAEEYLPVFNRSSMDGYSVIAADTKGASEENPVVLKLAGEVLMGDAADKPLEPGTCIYTPTGAAVPEGTESVVMVEETKNNGDGTISFLKEIAPNKNVILKGEDVYPGKVVLEKGRILTVCDIGALAVLGRTEVCVAKKPLVGILSTGDELIDISESPLPGQVRDVNTLTLTLLVEELGAIAHPYGIVKDEEEALFAKVKAAIEECDMVLISGGSSMGEKDATEKIIDELGTLILHGIRMKPGKPTIVGDVGGKPVLGVPGNPISAYFVTRVFVKKILHQMMGAKSEELFVDALLTKDMTVNKQRSQFNFAKLHAEDWVCYAEPIKMQSGLMTSIAGSDAFFATMLGTGDRKDGDKVTVHPL